MRERAPKVLRGPVPRNKEDDQVVYIDGDSAPRILFSGEDLLLEDLPIGTRVIYPKPPLEGLANPGAAIRYALNHPLEAEPLYALLAPGMKVTIALDDISLPLPPMVTPDIRQMVLEIVLELLAANGVDDMHIIIATGAAPAHDRRRDEADGGRRRSSTPSTRTASTTTTPRTRTAWCTLGRTDAQRAGRTSTGAPSRATWSST